MSKSFDDYEEEELIEIKAKLIHESKDAYCVMIDEDSFAYEAVRYWLPKTQTRNNEDGTFTMPEWLAAAKGIE